MRPRCSALTLALAACLAALGGCDGDGGGTNPDRLTPAEVAGTYRVCVLRFVPTQTALPEADVLARVMNTTPPATLPAPSVSLSGTAPQYELVYARRGDNFLQQLRGGVSFTEDAVGLSLGGEASAVVRESLLPSVLTLSFNAGQRLLGTSGTPVYSVRRADYARAAGVTEEGLQERINGRLTAVFVADACP
jgi:hypothetical protein